MNDRSNQQRGAVVGALALTLLGAAAVAPMGSGGADAGSWSLSSIERGLAGLRDDLAHGWWKMAGPMRADDLHRYAAAEEPELEALALQGGYPGEELRGRLFSSP